MSDASFAWDHFDQHTDTAVVRSARQQLAGELAQDLLGSKAAARRAFATGQLSADGRALQHNDQLAKDDAVELRLCRAIPQADPNGPAFYAKGNTETVKRVVTSDLPKYVKKRAQMNGDYSASQLKQFRQMNLK